MPDLQLIIMQELWKTRLTSSVLFKRRWVISILSHFTLVIDMVFFHSGVLSRSGFSQRMVYVNQNLLVEAEQKLSMPKGNHLLWFAAFVSVCSISKLVESLLVDYVSLLCLAKHLSLSSMFFSLPWWEELCAALCEQVLRGLAYLHDQQVHCCSATDVFWKLVVSFGSSISPI